MSESLLVTLGGVYGIVGLGAIVIVVLIIIAWRRPLDPD